MRTGCSLKINEKLKIHLFGEGMEYPEK